MSCIVGYSDKSNRYNIMNDSDSDSDSDSEFDMIDELMNEFIEEDKRCDDLLTKVKFSMDNLDITKEVCSKLGDKEGNKYFDMYVGGNSMKEDKQSRSSSYTPMIRSRVTCCSPTISEPCCIATDNITVCPQKFYGSDDSDNEECWGDYSSDSE